MKHLARKELIFLIAGKPKLLSVYEAVQNKRLSRRRLFKLIEAAINESPYMDPEFQLTKSDIQKDLDLVTTAYKNGSYKEIPIRLPVSDNGKSNSVVYHTSLDRECYFLFDKEIDEVWFLSELQPDNISGKSVAIQTTVWKNPFAPAADRFRDITVNLIFNLFLQEYDGIISDGIQSVHGKNLWKRIISIAAKSDKYRLAVVQKNRLDYLDKQLLFDFSPDDFEKLYDPVFIRNMGVGAGQAANIRLGIFNK